MQRSHSAFNWACRAGMVVALGLGLSACAVGRLSVGQIDDGASGQLHRSFLEQAAAISKCAWDEVRSSGSKFGAWATILLEGRDKSDPTVLAASSRASPATSYLALKAKTYSTPKDQLSAVVADLTAKTSQVDTFIGFADELAADYHTHLANFSLAVDSHRSDERRVAIKADRRVLEHAVAELKSQKATYEAVRRQLTEDQPQLDTSGLASAIAGFDMRIDRLTVLAESMVGHSAT